VISSDKTLAARAALAHLGRVNEAQARSKLGLHSIVLHDHAAGAATMRVSENPTIWRSADASRRACAGWMSTLKQQLVEQRLAFGEPAVDRREKLASLIPLALIAPAYQSIGEV